MPDWIAATLHTQRILRIELTVTDLRRSERFYVAGLGFAVVARGEADPAMAALLSADRITTVELRLGGQTLVLQAFEPPGACYPADAASSDQVFQHFAIPVVDMDASVTRLQAMRPVPISDGPQHLPARSGGAVAFKFRDPDGHPLELIQFPNGHDVGIDHSAIVVMDANRSIAFYRDHLGFDLASSQINTGQEQDRLDGLSDVTVEVVALTPHRPMPHLELLAYRSPTIRTTRRLGPKDVAATRLVLEVDGLPADTMRLSDGKRVVLIHDPDEHALLLISPAVTSKP
jgi:catechol 2,3-dioxygenase-like lactoylglutathione lyase family enzyme